MKRLVKWLLILLVVLMAGWLAVAGVLRTRDLATSSRCQNNLKLIGVALHNYHSGSGSFPPGTVPNAGLPPDRRLSWITEIHPTCIVRL